MDEERREFANSVVWEAGAILAGMFEKHKSFKIEEKARLDYVGEADKKSQEFLISEIKKNFPEDDFISEEWAEVEREKRTNYRWIIDPLCGSHNFYEGINPKVWGILLALQEKFKVVLGVCAFPMLEEFFVAEKGKGAFLNGRRIKVSDAADLKGQIFLPDGIMREKPQEILRDIERFCSRSVGCRFRVYGSTPFSFTRVAYGHAAVAINRFGKPWDIAAPALIVEEAGGKITDDEGNPWSIDSKNLIATNGLVHNKSLMLFDYKGVPAEMVPYYLKASNN